MCTCMYTFACMNMYLNMQAYMYAHMYDMLKICVTLFNFTEYGYVLCCIVCICICIYMCNYVLYIIFQVF